MSNSGELLESVLSGKLELDCVKMKLTQNGSASPAVYEGSGTIWQDGDGFLHLKMYHSIANFSNELKSIFDPFTPGEILGDEHYYSLEAMDMSGHVWKTDRLYINKSNVSMHASAMIIKSKPREITYTSDRRMSDRTTVSLTAAGKYEIPCNVMEKLSNGAVTLNTLKFTTEDGIEMSFKKSDNRLDIQIDGPTANMLDNIEDRVILALSIILGRRVNPCFMLKRYSDITQTTVKSVEFHQSDGKLLAPIGHSSPDHAKQFQQFVTGI